ncbi:hypothetical protein HYS10_01530 [Candidatus Collierbacteria bacterium]|nr:hypothetical protein [Candidatus Collierbacteria bacterium]
MALVVRKKQGQNLQQLINEFRRLTWEDTGLEKVKETAMKGYQKPSAIRKERNDRLRKERMKIRRRNKRAARGGK